MYLTTIMCHMTYVDNDVRFMCWGLGF